MSDPIPMCFEAFAAINGAYPDWGDCGMHKTSRYVSLAKKNRELQRMVEKDYQTNLRRNQLRDEYTKLCEEGKMRPLTRIEQLQYKAAGNPDRDDVQAAIRLLKKKGLWQETSIELMKEREGE